MNAHILICGLVGGLFAVFALSLPLMGKIIPNQITPLHSPTIQNAGYGLAVLIGVGFGYIAACWSWAESTFERIKCGALAGLLVGLVAFSLIGAPAAAVASQAPIFEHGAHSALNNRDATYIVAECTVRACWYPYLAFWALVGGGVLLGGLGGFLSSRFGKTPWGNAPQKSDGVFDGNFSLILMINLILMIATGAIITLEQACQGSVAKYGFELSMPVGGITGCFIASHLAFLVISTWYCGKWSAQRWRHPTQGVRVSARMAKILTGLLQVVTLVWAASSYWTLFVNWVFLLGMAAWLGASLFWVVQIWLATRCLSPSEIAVSQSENITVILPLRDRLKILAFLILVFCGLYALSSPMEGYFLCLFVAIGVAGFWTNRIKKGNPVKAKPNEGLFSSISNRLIINAAFMGFTFSALPMVSVTPAIAIADGIVPYIGVLFSTIDTPEIASNTIALATSPSGTGPYGALAILLNDKVYGAPNGFLHPNASEQTLKIFVLPVMASIQLVFFWFVAAAIHLGVVLYNAHRRRVKGSVAEGGTDPAQVSTGNT